MRRYDTISQLHRQRHGSEELASTLEDMAGELLNDLCRDLTIAAATACGTSARSQEARKRRVEHAAAIHTVLEVCALAGIEICDGPDWEGSLLGPPRRD